MPRRFPLNTGLRDDSPDNEPEKTSGAARSDPSSPGRDLKAVAQLVGTGEIPLPSDLLPEDLDLVVNVVRQRRRDRLVAYIARSIAADLRQACEQQRKVR